MNRIIKLHIYPFDLMLSIGESDKKLKKVLKASGITGLGSDDSWKFASPTAQGRSVMFPGNQSLLRLRSIPKTPAEFGTLNHEIFHIVTFIMDRVGMKLKLLQSDEAYAYLIGYITKEILTIFEEKI